MPSLTARLNVIEKLHILSAPAAMPSNWNTSGHPTTTQGIREVVRKALPNQAPTETDAGKSRSS
ncbi:hypothetical protein [Hymenobacter crusticola]|uniref:hypothetical protein n=1 Tax=Hymenobacter crusticola TaxID=1770526 RepID=UPI00117B288D|nr:hypothetical protein [Hymenobacter crusticola]